MQNRKPGRWSLRRSMLVVCIAVLALALFYGGYQLGRDMALRDNARQAAGR